jgi:thiol-disulfide isomerase/thioredoxin
MTRKSGFVVLVAVAVAAVVAGVWTVRQGTENQANPPIQGAVRQFTVSRDRPPSPAATLVAADGKETSLAAYKGRIVVANFWATWCAPCIKEMPSLDRLRAKLGDDGVAVVAISEDLKGWPVIAPFLDDHDLKPLPVLWDPEGGMQRAFGVSVLPTTLILSRDGRVEGTLVGAVEWDSEDAMRLVRYYAERTAR